ncbi:class I SAM-dependent rRNA methyltransferase [Aureimonas fodinaquatilis]|uniref:Class I SAM-dependent rRNA methyltransferase n=1 Tax=Aureimonas fodinaquatilis TaxID=2565783 RepID=A0A5B0DSJ2_9HYPH|nr:class I SAM-dependent methyltransferase [Aureimonas fodinaquatilis]KAA0968550.1 class I SAM-dependent rRNA methyltransferase [Aureimonas fodinaquatilis]
MKKIRDKNNRTKLAYGKEHTARPVQKRVQSARPRPPEPAAEPAARPSAAERGEEARSTRPDIRYHSGARPDLQMPEILTVEPGSDYALLDSGDGEKLERYGPITIRRPENQAIWRPRLSASEWDAADAVFTGDTDEEGTGRWRFPNGDLGETWPMAQDGLPYLGRFTSYRHVGVFPEQAAHWRFVEEAVKRAGRPVRVLNLFGYTGLASLLAARAGAEVTHVDASKKAIQWARQNQELAGLEDKPIRWICEDAVRYAEREMRRDSRYDIILLDPPKFGRGPKGEVWQIFEDLPYLLSLMRGLLSENPISLILTAYSIRSSFYSLAALMEDHCRGLGGVIQSGELIIREAGDDPRLLSTSLFSRWVGS